MLDDTLRSIPRRLFSQWMAQVASAFFLLLTLWWISLHPFLQSDVLVGKKYIWGSSYQIIALWGGVCGLVIAQTWGGFKSIIGRAIMFFSLGLLFQVFGQTVYSYYNLFAKIQAPYPSLGDIGFFGSIPMYIYGGVLLAKASGVKVSLRSFDSKAQAFFIPFIALSLSYIVFLRGYEFDFSQPLKIFLDFGYPLGQAIYVSVAILTLLLCRKILGGIMKYPVLFFLVALIFQYVSDYTFLYQASRNIWYVGGMGDFLYSVSYLLMTFALVYMNMAFKHIQKT